MNCCVTESPREPQFHHQRTARSDAAHRRPPNRLIDARCAVAIQAVVRGTAPRRAGADLGREIKAGSDICHHPEPRFAIARLRNG